MCLPNHMLKPYSEALFSPSLPCLMPQQLQPASCCQDVLSIKCYISRNLYTHFPLLLCEWLPLCISQPEQSDCSNRSASPSFSRAALWTCVHNWEINKGKIEVWGKGEQVRSLKGFIFASVLFRKQGTPAFPVLPVYSWCNGTKRVCEKVCTFQTLKFQLFPPLEDSTGQCWFEWSHLSISITQYVVHSLILSSPRALGKGMADSEMWEKRSSRLPVCSTLMSKENWKSWGTVLCERQKWETPQEMAGSEAEQMNGFIPTQRCMDASLPVERDK